MTDARQIDLEDYLETHQKERSETKKEQTARRQREYLARQKAQGRKPLRLLVTDDERFYLERTLEAMRQTGGYPCSLRDRLGRFRHLDV